MENIDKKTEFLPRYSLAPAIILVIMHFTVYYATKPLQEGLVHHTLGLKIDELIPFLPQWSLIYAVTFIFWIISAVVLMRQGREKCFRFFAGLAIAEIICTVFFIAFPTVIERPEIISTEYGAKLLSQMYANDVPVNLFPSMHCMMSYMMFRYFMYCKNTDKWYILSSGIFVSLICASTLFVKQHYFIDCIAGIVFGEAAVWLCLNTSAWKAFDKLDRALFKAEKTEKTYFT